MAFSTFGKNQMLDSLVAAYYVSAHTADPGDSGTNEVAGGVYARQLISFAPASGGSRDSDVQPGIPIPGGTDVTHVGLWDSPAGGNFLGSFSVGTTRSFADDGTLNVTDMDLTI